MAFETDSRYLAQFEPKLSGLGRDRDLWWVVPFSVRYIVGIGGHRFSGSSTSLTFLGEKLGFKLYSLSHELRQIARAQGVPLDSRSRLQDLGDELRAEHADGGYLARLTLERIRADHLRDVGGRARIAVGGFKHPDEVAVFDELARFHFLCLKVGVGRRYGRAVESGMLSVELAGTGCPEDRTPTRTEFVTYVDKRDRDGRRRYGWTGEYGQWVDGVLQRSGARRDVIDNGRINRATLFGKLTRLAKDLDGKYQRPEL